MASPANKWLNVVKEKYVTLKPMPLFIGYFIAWANSRGELTFRSHVYGTIKKWRTTVYTQIAGL
jgi:hypothetical protein